jgi:toxin-antitoxin system PIN domain toxin
LSASARLFDTGVWIGLAFDSHPLHRLARDVFESADSERPIAFCRATQNSFLRLLTTPAIQALYGGPAVTNAQAWAKSQELLALPQVVWLAEPVALESEWKRCGGVETVSPKVWMDAYLAAFAISGDLELVTFDRDFANFTRHGFRLTLLEAKAAGTRKPRR